MGKGLKDKSPKVWTNGESRLKRGPKGALAKSGEVCQTKLGKASYITLQKMK